MNFRNNIPLRRLAILLSVLLLLPIFSSCITENTHDTSSVLSEMVSAAKDLPIGRIYTTKSSPGSPDFLSESLLAALYGIGRFPDVFSRAKSISLWLSSGLSTCEFAVFHCANRRDAEEISDLCIGRIDTMRHFINANSHKLSIESTSSENLENAKVVIVGKYVIMAISSNSQTSIAAAKDLIS